MRKLFIILLITAIGGALAYFFLPTLNLVVSRYFWQKESAEIDRLARQFKSYPSDVAPLNALRERLYGEWSFSRSYTCSALRELGPIAAAATPDLLVALNCGDPFVEREAALALGEVAIGRADAVGPLIEKLRDVEDDAAWFSAEALGKFGVPSSPAISALEKASRSPNDIMADNAARALKDLKERGRQAGEKENDN